MRPRRRTAPDVAETVTVTEAARLAGVTRGAIERRIERGQLPYFKHEGLRRIAVADLQRLGLLKGEPPPVESAVDDTIARLERSVRETASAVVQLRRELAAERAGR